MFSLYKLQAKSYFVNVFTKIDFFINIMFLVVLGSIAVLGMPGDWGTDNYEEKISYLNMSIISSVILMMVMNTAMNSFGMSFFQMKNSVLLKRIGATKISKFEAIGSFLLWGFTSMLLSLAWMSIWIGIFQIPQIGASTNGMLYVSPMIWKSANYGGMILAIIITTFAFYAISFFFVSISKTIEIYEIISTFYFFLVAILGGSLTPNANRDWMVVISYISPLGWGTQLMSDSSLEGANYFFIEKTGEGLTSNVFNWVNGYHVLDIEKSFVLGSDGNTSFKPEFIHISSLRAVGSVVFPVVYGASAGLASRLFFSWD